MRIAKKSERFTKNLDLTEILMHKFNPFIVEISFHKRFNKGINKNVGFPLPLDVIVWPERNAKNIWLNYSYYRK